MDKLKSILVDSDRGIVALNGQEYRVQFIGRYSPEAFTHTKYLIFGMGNDISGGRFEVKPNKSTHVFRLKEGEVIKAITTGGGHLLTYDPNGLAAIYGTDEYGPRGEEIFTLTGQNRAYSFVSGPGGLRVEFLASPSLSPDIANACGSWLCVDSIPKSISERLFALSEEARGVK